MDDRIYKRRYRILSVLMLGPIMCNLDSSIVNLALPVMARSMGVGISAIQWVVTAYLITLAALILIFGKIADRVGKRAVFVWGFLVFGAGSLMSALSGDFTFLIVSRVVQAVGAAMFMSSNQGIIATVFPPQERGRAMGLIGSAVAIGAMAGPPLGGLLVGAFAWQSIFIVNIPIAAFAFVAGLAIIPRDEVNVKAEAGFDFVGAATFVLAMVSLFWALLSGEAIGWGSWPILACLALGLGGFYAFYRVERAAERPMLDISAFRNRLFSVSIVCASLSFAVIFSVNIIHPFYLQYALGLSPGTAGLLMLALPLAQCLVAPLSGYLADKLGAEPITVAGLAVMLVGLVLMSTLSLSSSYAAIVAYSVLASSGSAIFSSPNTSIIMGLSPRDRLGITGSINAEARNIGMVSGIALSVALLYDRMGAAAGRPVSGYVDGRPDIFLYGMRVVYLAAAGLCAVGILLTLARMRSRGGERKGE
jgi:EmrB/QacA subfamily drug resistance transporter